MSDRGTPSGASADATSGSAADGASGRGVGAGAASRLGVGSLSFRARVTLALVTASLVPLGSFGAVLLWTNAAGSRDPDSPLGRLHLFALMAAGLGAVFIALLLATNLMRPLRAFAAAVERVSDGDRRTRIDVPGEDELALLADRYNRLAAELDLRDLELNRIRTALTAIDPGTGRDRILSAAATGIRDAFGMSAAEVILGDPDDLPITEDVPGEPRPVRAILRLGFDEFGVLAGTLPATRQWEAADQMLLELFVAEVAFAIRNAELIERVETQNARLRDLDAAKDDFLRGISHNLQTPLTSISASAEQLAAERPDSRLELIVEQAGRLSRMVRQLLTVSRLDAGTVRPRSEVLALAPRVRRAWDALSAAGTAFTLRDDAPGWLAVADPDQLDQVLWALLDNAVRHGGGTPVSVEIRAVEVASELRLTVADAGPGVDEAHRHRLFSRYERLGGTEHSDGSGLGLYVSRELCRAMGGDLLLESPGAAGGAAFTAVLPAEPPEPVGDG